MGLIRRCSAAWIAIFFVYGSAFADWDGSVRLTGSEKGFPVSGSVSATGESLRYDFDVGGRTVSTIVDARRGKTEVLVHSRKQVLSTEHDQARYGVLCVPRVGSTVLDRATIDQCLFENGFQATGKDTFDGHPCVVYETRRTGLQLSGYHQRIWRPLDIDDVALIKSISTFDSGKTIGLEITGIVKRADAKVDGTKYRVPAGYKRMTEEP